jgi:uncharacterized OsmC-like protein
MSERILVRQTSDFTTEFSAADPHGTELAELTPVAGLHQLTPYGMLFAGLASCTAIVLHTYAQNHEIPLEAVELWVSYERVFNEDCQNCEGVERYQDIIHEQILLEGDLSDEQRQKLHHIAGYCPIAKMLEKETPLQSALGPDGAG